MLELRIIIIAILFSNLIIAQSKYELVEKEWDGSCTIFKVVNEKGKEINLPVKFKDILDCPAMIDVTDNIITYEFKNTVCLYNIDNEEDIALFNNYNDIDACCGPAWSKDKTKVMFVIINQQMKHNYKAPCRIIVISLDKNGKPIKKQKFDKNVNFVCGNNCYSSPDLDFWFVNKNTIEFKLHEAYENKFPTEKIILD